MNDEHHLRLRLVLVRPSGRGRRGGVRRVCQGQPRLGPPRVDAIMALKLSRPCPHCGEELIVAFRSDLKGDLMAAVVHGLLESMEHQHHRLEAGQGLRRHGQSPVPDAAQVPW